MWHIINFNINQQLMKDLGVKVLTRIQNLISEIDNPLGSTPKRKMLRIKPDQSVSFGGYPQKDKSRLFAQMSYNYTRKEQNINKRLLNRVYNDEQQFNKYRITNKKTIQILKKKQIKPIHQRIDEILQKKQRYVQDFKRYENQEEDKSMRSAIDHRHSFNKFNQQGLYYYRNQIDHRNHQRIKRKHFNKLPFVKKQDQYHKIPAVNQVSRSLSERRNLRKKYSQNVFKRMSQYIYQEGERKTERVRKRTQEEGGFSPAIDPHSRIIANKLKIKRSPDTRLPQMSASKFHQSKGQIKKDQKKIVQKEIVCKSPSFSKVIAKIDKRQTKNNIQTIINVQQQKTSDSKQNISKSRRKITPSKKAIIQPTIKKYINLQVLNESTNKRNTPNKITNKK